MNSETKRLPFFVYGTLLPGQPNYDLWAQYILSKQTAVFANGRLLDLGNYPMLVEKGNDPVKGMVVTIKPAAYEAVTSRLDHLEGYDPHNPNKSEYVRMERHVYLADGTAVNAWVYLGQILISDNIPLVNNGDWVSHIHHRRQKIEAWWQQINTVSGLHDELP